MDDDEYNIDNNDGGGRRVMNGANRKSSEPEAREMDDYTLNGGAV